MLMNNPSGAYPINEGWGKKVYILLRKIKKEVLKNPWAARFEIAETPMK
jgi:hypothetical protein